MDYYRGPVKLVLFDVDGVLTNGDIFVDGNGEALKSFSTRDGIAVGLLRAHGVKCGVLSGKSSPSLQYRVNQLKFDVALTGRLDKRSAYAEIKDQLSLTDSQVVYVGDDVVDLPLMGTVGAFYAPSDAHPLVLQRADHVVKSIGGKGVAREVAELVLMGDGLSLEQIYLPLINQWEKHHAVQ
jgi:3-deoxy-D-manno-octulosonate 8-phosphate phosphatase (KDO 8-P phosphatase)